VGAALSRIGLPGRLVTETEKGESHGRSQHRNHDRRRGQRIVAGYHRQRNLESPVNIGTATTSLVGFYGSTAVDQGATVTTVTTTAATSTTPYGYSTSTQADAVVTAVNAIIARLVPTTGVGLIAGA
jgi:hypothetical protein